MFAAVGRPPRVAAAIVAVTACYLVTGTEQIPPKWYKPLAWDGPAAKHSHLTSYKPKSPSYPAAAPLPQPYGRYAHPSALSYGHQHAVKPLKTEQQSCQLRKVVFTQDAESPQYIVYKSKIPDLKEFTLCHWHNIFNYTHDQPIFSYTHSGKSRVIYSWIENSPDKTYYSLAVNGHTLYRINYPEKLFKWYQVCQSWNGHTGEWQLWINTERVGRGFYNLMVGRIIKGGGVAISGREYLEQAMAVHHPAYSGELTLVTLYKAALTAGKAYNNHKHHHVHNFHHGYDEAVDEADGADDGPAAMMPAGPDPTLPPHLAHGGPFVNGQLAPKLPVVPAAAAAAAAEDDDDPFLQQRFPSDYGDRQPFDGGLYDFYGSAAANGGELQQLLVTAPSTTAADETFRVNLLDPALDDGRADRYKRNATAAADGPKRFSAKTRRTARSSGGYPREPAEWEVTKVAAVCRACEPDPFGTATVVSWHDTRKQFYNGALYLPALPKCYMF